MRQLLYSDIVNVSGGYVGLADLTSSCDALSYSYDYIKCNCYQEYKQELKPGMLDDMSYYRYTNNDMACSNLSSRGTIQAALTMVVFGVALLGWTYCAVRSSK